MKKLLALLMSCVMVFCMVPVSAFAQETIVPTTDEVITTDTSDLEILEVSDVEIPEATEEEAPEAPEAPEEEVIVPTEWDVQMETLNSPSSEAVALDSYVSADATTLDATSFTERESNNSWSSADRVYDDYLVEPLAQVLINLGVKRGMVVYGQDKLDEISMSAPTSVCEIKDGWFKSYVITPEQFGFERCRKEELTGGTPEENAQITLAILKGEKGPKRNAVLMNAGAALYIGGKAKNMEEGISLAEELIDSGKAYKTLEKLIEVSNRPEVEE